MNQNGGRSPLHKDVFFRSHVVELDPKEPLVSTYNEPIWPDYALVLDSETTLDPREQSLLFGFYRVCRSWGSGEYLCVEEGIFHADNLERKYLDIINNYASRDSEVVSDDYDDDIHVYSRSQFVEKVFFDAVRTRSLVVAFNAPVDISRLSVGYKPSRNREWSLVLTHREFDVEKLRNRWLTRKWKFTKNGNLRTCCGSYTVVIKKNGGCWSADIYTPDKQRISGVPKSAIDDAKLDGFRLLSEHVEKDKQNGPVLEPNPERPRVIVTSKDSKAAFFRLTKPYRPEEWPTYEEIRNGKENIKMIFRVLDLRTLGWALFNESWSLKVACKELKTKHQKYDHEPTGTVTIEELDYARQDVRCTVDVLNSLKEEFDQHRFNEQRTELYPDKAVSPASIGKAYLRAMGIIPLKKKFDVPDYIHGIASQAYFGGRAECRIRNTPVPVVLTDFSSQYPTINSLLGNPEILRAETLCFEGATAEISNFVEQIALDNCFDLPPEN